MSEKEADFFCSKTDILCHTVIFIFLRFYFCCNSVWKFELKHRLGLERERENTGSSHKQSPPSEREKGHAHTRADKLNGLVFEKFGLFFVAKLEKCVVFFHRFLLSLVRVTLEPTSQTNRNVHVNGIGLCACVCGADLLLLRQCCRRQGLLFSRIFFFLSV